MLDPPPTPLPMSLSARRECRRPPVALDTPRNLACGPRVCDLMGDNALLLLAVAQDDQETTFQGRKRLRSPTSAAYRREGAAVEHELAHISR